MTFKRFIAAALALLLLLGALPELTSALAEDYIAKDSLCMAVQSGVHDWRLDHYEDANCLHGKFEIDLCRNCKKYCRTTISDKGPHVFPSTWETLSEATCTEAGQQIHYCTVCKNASETRSIPALGHDWGAWKTITEASCTKEGLKARSCNRCGKRETEKITGAHQWGAWETDIPGTCIRNRTKDALRYKERR